MTLNDAAAYASLVGLVLTLAGFGVTIVKLLQTNKVAAEAKQSVLDLTDKLMKHDLLSELNVIIGEAELINHSSLELQTFLCSRLRQLLIRFVELYPNIDEECRTMLKICIADLKQMEKGLLHAEMNTRNSLINIKDRLVTVASKLRNDLKEG